MNLPFTTEQFFNVIEKYNLSVFPLQFVILFLGIICLFLRHRNPNVYDKILGSFLGILWIWTGIVYHLIFFTEINKAANVFGGIFILQGLLFIYNALVTERLKFSYGTQIKDYVAYIIIAYGLIIYPVISFFVEGSFNKTILLGLPCPSTIFTFGLIILTTQKFPKYLLIIPSIWAVIGLSAAIHIGVIQDVMIIISAIVAVFFCLKIQLD